MSIRRRTWTTPSGEEKSGWQCDYRDSSGRRRSKQFDRKKDAEAWLTTAAYEVAQGIHTADSQSITVARAAELWLERGKRDGLEASTIASYDQHVRLHINPLCGARKLSQLTKPIIERYRDELADKVSRPMAVRVLRSLAAIIDEAQRRGYVAHNVAKGVKFRRAMREKSSVTVPTKSELRALIVAAERSPEPIALPVILIAIYGGLRASEIRGLTWRNVDVKSGSLSIDQRADNKNLIGPPKSQAGYRAIPLPQSAVRALREWKLACPPTRQNLVFPSLAGRVMSYPYLSNSIVRPLQTAAGLLAHETLDAADQSPEQNGGAATRPRYTLHDFRHAAASLWIDQMSNPKRVQYWMGHSSIQVTFDTYGHLFVQAEQDRAVVDAIEKEISGSPSAT